VKRCRTCGEEFDRKLLRRGYVDQCDDCSDDKVKPYVGRRDDKHGDVMIFRTNLVFVQNVLDYENRVGRNANLMISSTVKVRERDLE